MSKKIGVIVGSLRKESFNRKLARQLIELAPSSYDYCFIEIGELPFYNEDLESAEKTVSQWQTFRNNIKDCAGILFCTPEYNRSVPAVLKNAIDVGSRPYGQSAWAKKPTAIVSASLGAIGGFGANHHLRQSFVFLDMPCMQQPEAYIGSAHELFDASGQLKNDNTKQFLQNYIKTFTDWVSQHS